MAKSPILKSRILFVLRDCQMPMTMAAIAVETCGDPDAVLEMLLELEADGLVRHEWVNMHQEWRNPMYSPRRVYSIVAADPRSS